MDNFDFTAPADVFAGGGRGARTRPVHYRRFQTGAEAVRHAMEELPAELQPGVVLEADDARFSVAEIRNLYESDAYPLVRRREH